jgi:DNA polymerase
MDSHSSSAGDPGPERAPSLADAIAAAQEWWREAGVDLTFEDEATTWLAEPADPADGAPAKAQERRAPPPPPASPPAPRLGGDAATWPQDLDQFTSWWLDDASLDAGGLGPRIAPRGGVGAPLMIVVPMPEDGDDQVLLSGPEGRLLAGFALAAGIDPAALYIASALPRRMVSPDWTGLAERGLGDLLRHHVALAAPQRLLVLGRDILPLLAHDPAISAPGRQELQVQGTRLPMLAHYAPARLLAHAALRAGLWQRWLEFTDGTGMIA